MSDQWPKCIRSLVEQYGAGPVWRVGLAELQYPPNWCLVISEVSRVEAALKQEHETMVNVNANKVESEDDVKGFDRPLAGRYHVAIKNVDESLSKLKTSIPVEFEVLAGTTPGQQGKTHTEFFSTSEKAGDRFLKLALATDLIAPGENKDVAIADGIGRQLVIELEEHSYEKNGETKKSVRITFLGMWSVGNAEVKDVPKDEAAMKQGLPAATAAASSGSDDNWGDI